MGISGEPVRTTATRTNRITMSPGDRTITRSKRLSYLYGVCNLCVILQVLRTWTPSLPPIRTERSPRITKISSTGPFAWVSRSADPHSPLPGRNRLCTEFRRTGQCFGLDLAFQRLADVIDSDVNILYENTLHPFISRVYILS